MAVSSRVRVATVLLFAGGLIALATPARAQVRSAGWQVSFGPQYGTSKASCDGCTDASFKGGIGGFVRFGFRAGEQFYLGLEGTGHLRDVEGSGGTSADGRVGYGSVFAQLYPSPDHTFWVKIGLGIGYVEAAWTPPGSTATRFEEKTGFGATGAVGFDVALSNTIAVSPQVTVGYAPVGDIVVSGVDAIPGVSVFTLSFGLGLTIF